MCFNCWRQDTKWHLLLRIVSLLSGPNANYFLKSFRGSNNLASCKRYWATPHALWPTAWFVPSPRPKWDCKDWRGNCHLPFEIGLKRKRDCFRAFRVHVICGWYGIFYLWEDADLRTLCFPQVENTWLQKVLWRHYQVVGLSKHAHNN